MPKLMTTEERCIYNAAWYLLNRDKRREQLAATRDNVRRVLREAKSKPCADCGQIYPHYVMDFDHVRGSKKSCLAKVRSVKLAESEMLKCEVVCANCHRERTYRRMVK